MYVVATAGHVDHGKSTLVRALTGVEPDRLAEEQRRGMTLDLGFAWTQLPGGQSLAFVDVPGHERFVTTMLAGVGPVPAAVVVVAADGGWSAQTTEHVAILNALDVRHGVLVVTRSDLADPRPVLTYARERLSRTSLAAAEACAVSAVTGQGMATLRAALGRLVDQLPPPATEGRIRLFVDRSFTIRGSGTVVTGTLGRGRLEVGDRLELLPAGLPVRVRGLQALGAAEPRVSAIARVAVNLRSVAAADVRRGHVLVTPESWAPCVEADVRLLELDPADLPGDLVFHIGSAGIACRLRPLGTDTARVRLAGRLPLQAGDRAVLRDPSRRVTTGLVVLDVDPPPLRRRGAARARADQLDRATGEPDPVAEITRRGIVTRARLAILGILPVTSPAPAGVLEIADDYLVDHRAWAGWSRKLVDAVAAHYAERPHDAGLPVEAARRLLGVPTIQIVETLVRDSAGRLVSHRGRIALAGTAPTFSSDVRAALEQIQQRLDASYLSAPEAEELAGAGLTRSVLAAAAQAGLFLRLAGDVLVHPDAPDRASARLAELTQPFTLSEARQALGTTRRVAIPLLAHLDALGRTMRVDSSLRRMR